MSSTAKQVTTKKVAVKEFAQKVERLCEFLINKKIEESGRDGSSTLRILEDLKEEAWDLQTYGTDPFEGLTDFMNGVT